MSARNLRAAALISGGGRTVASLVQSIECEGIPVDLDLVIAHDEALEGVRRCRELGIRVEVVPGSPGVRTSDRMDEILVEHGTDLLCLCGYLRRFRVEPLWRDRVMNIHPALLPEFGGRGMYGDHVHRAVLEAGRSRTGCTVHWVDEEYDHGDHILQKTCQVEPDDTLESLAERVFALECRAYPEAVKSVADELIERVHAGLDQA
ncbi:MAG: formyltransferase family protein [Planctomycetota bacterium]|nr:formyltransferase family protein [Planctomycetota bacterium]